MLLTKATTYDVVLLLSGGLDSTSALVRYVAEGKRVLNLVFDYGQTLARECAVAEANADRYGSDFVRVRAPMGWIAPGCALFNGDIPRGRTMEQIAAGGTPPTYVPFRNGIMLAYAAAVAETLNVRVIACGGNGLASGNYWDDTLDFAQAMQRAIRAGTAPREPGAEYVVEFPNATMTKAEVVRLGVARGMVVDATWSCYGNGPEPCGTCDSCVQRQAAIAEATS